MLLTLRVRRQLLQEIAKDIETDHQTWNHKLLIVGAMAELVVADDTDVAADSPIPLPGVMPADPVM
jgi:hypothetical protein